MLYEVITVWQNNVSWHQLRRKRAGRAPAEQCADAVCKQRLGSTRSALGTDPTELDPATIIEIDQLAGFELTIDQTACLWRHRDDNAETCQARLRFFRL